MKKMIAKDMPKWAISLFEKNSNVELSFFEMTGFKTYVATLPTRNKLDMNQVKFIETKIDDKYLDILNKIDYSKVQSSKLEEIKNFLIDFFKNKGNK